MSQQSCDISVRHSVPFPSPVFNMYLINLSIMTFHQRYYSGALNKANTTHSGLARSDVALLLQRCQMFRRNAPHSCWMRKDSGRPLPPLSEFGGPEFSVYSADKSPRLANRQVGRRSNLTSCVVTVTKPSCPVKHVHTRTHLAHTRSNYLIAHGPPSEHFVLRSTE
jgi:hypothetical protein